MTTASALIYAGLMVYLGASSLVFIELLGVPVQWYGLIFTTTVMGYMLGSFTSARLSAHRSSEQLARPASCGKVLDGQDIIILDDEGTKLEPGKVASIVLVVP